VLRYPLIVCNPHRHILDSFSHVGFKLVKRTLTKNFIAVFASFNYAGVFLRPRLTKLTIYSMLVFVVSLNSNSIQQALIILGDDP
jgi:hypothetical protein